MTPDDEVAFNCHLINGVDPLTALAALRAETPAAAATAAADPAGGSNGAAFRIGLLCGVVLVLVVVLWAH